ncbi:trypsin-like serine protease [Corynebacterium suranareeae]|uniref:Trypsin-like serine protease n=1 Tax=Corynebacterium suranareeae TaxID=2506452 RepID=A0A160PN80_9CORY|nr:trypsin-like peptidase domain-containing protein [Corynebacterium suranareeae]BAU95269.1 trypsin-like serine protease [Corynebacterium suranareeae]
MTNQFPTNNGENPDRASAETNSFEHVRSSYPQWGNTTSNQNPYPNASFNAEQSAQPENEQQPPAWTSWDNQPLSTDVKPAKEKRKVGVGTALALMLVGSVVTGSVVGIAATQFGSDSSTPFNALEQPSVQRTTNAEPGSAEQVASAVLPSVVSIQAITRTAASEGSGSIISSDGYVMTNNHVVAGVEQSGVLEVSFSDGTTAQADFIAGDPSTDIAVIKIRDVSDLPVMSFGDSDSLTVGQDVMAVGSPLGLSSTVTTGIVSAINRPVRASGEGGESSLIDAIQTDAAINPGNSGGPLVDMEGNLIGMNSVIASISSTSDTAGSIGLGFAIPSNFAKRVADQLISTGQVTQPMLGVQVGTDNSVSGAVIASVQDGGPGAEAGLQPGDVVTKLNDRVIDGPDSLIAAVRSHDFGETVTLTITQPDTSQSREVEVTLTSE